MEYCQLYQICVFCADIKKLSVGLESPHFLTVSTKLLSVQNFSTETVMENEEMVMEKSWKSVGTLD